MPPHPIILVVFICPFDKIFNILFTESDLVVNLPTLSIVAREFMFKEFALIAPVLSIVAKAVSYTHLTLPTKRIV